EPTGSGYVEVPIGSPGGIPGGAGGTNHPWPAPFDAGDPYDGGEWEIGTLPQVYGDTGIFFSTDPRTSKYVETTWMDGADPDIVSATVDNGYRIEPSACGQLTGFVGATECRTHNLWDAEMTNWFGSGGGTVPPVNPGDEPAGSEPHVAPRGRTPYLVGSAVAGPDTFYGYDYTGSTGPWERIQYPGSTIGFGPPNDLAIPDYAYTSVTPGVNDGRVLNESNPLPAGTNAIRWSVGELIVGDINFVKVSLRVLPAFDPAVCHAADAEVFGGDAGLDGGGKDSAWRYNEPAPAPGQTCMAISKTGPAVASTGGTASYTITLANVTAFPADNVVLTDLLDPGMGYVSASPAPDTVAGQNLTWNIGTLLAGEARTFTVDVDSLSGDVLLNTVTATSDDTPPAEARTSTYLGSLVDMSMSKTVAPDTQARNGTVTYTVTLTNDGNATALGVDLSDTLATGFTYVPGSTLVNGVPSSDPIGSGSGPLDWVLGDLAAGSSWVVSFDALVGDTVPLDAYYYNNFTTTWDETALPTTQSKTLLNQAPVYVAPPADLGVVKTDSADPVVPGIPLSYTLTVTNYGTEDATNVVVIDDLPSLFIYASATPDQGSCSYSAPTLTCDLGGLPNGASTDIVIDGSVSPTAVPGQLLQNVASVDGDQADSDPTNNTVVEPTFVTGPGGACRAVADTGGANGGDDLLTIIDHTDTNPLTNEVSIGTGT
ncbi:MAG: DUF11 domain-containing protein, partial [Acidimicrobiia bacterium]|nr:DUF11 domain-containing protein [Acidimicrobiia bacterium]